MRSSQGLRLLPYLLAEGAAAARKQWDFNHRAPMLYKVFQNAPPSVQTEVVKAQQITEREYMGLIYTINLIIREGP